MACFFDSYTSFYQTEHGSIYRQVQSADSSHNNAIREQPIYPPKIRAIRMYQDIKTSSAKHPRYDAIHHNFDSRTPQLSMLVICMYICIYVSCVHTRYGIHRTFQYDTQQQQYTLRIATYTAAQQQSDLLIPVFYLYQYAKHFTSTQLIFDEITRSQSCIFYKYVEQHSRYAVSRELLVLTLLCCTNIESRSLQFFSLLLWHRLLAFAYLLAAFSHREQKTDTSYDTYEYVYKSIPGTSTRQDSCN